MAMVRILSAGAAQAVVEQIAAGFERETGTEVRGDFSAVGAMKARVIAGEAVDVVILTAALIDELIALGHIVPGSRADLGRVGTGVAVRAGTPLPAGRGRGIAICENHGSVVGHVAEVTVDAAGRVRVDRVVAAVDCYHVVNPKIVEAQMEGGIIFGLTAALFGEITIRDGAVVEGNFDSYPMVRLSEAPQIEVYLSLTGGPRWGGIGECSTAPIAPAVTNAIFAATRKRVRELPLKNVRISELAQL